MTPPRFYCPSLVSTGVSELADAEAHHLAHVLRLAVGEPVELFNGKGLIGKAIVQQIRKRVVTCEVGAVTQEPRPTPEITLGTAVPKGDRFDWLIEKATELGVSRLVPLNTTRSTVDPRDSKLDRLRQTVIAACKQSRRAHLMELTPATSWPQFLEQAENHPLIVAHPQSLPVCPPESGFFSAGKLFLAVGPEGGFTDEEVAAATARGGRVMPLGEHVLRIETAALTLATWCLVHQSGAI
jgi:16S rRNA (uracil1498-N3)-methyltransferase